MVHFQGVHNILDLLSWNQEELKAVPAQQVYSLDDHGQGLYLMPCPNSDFGMHSRDAYPQFADVWVLPGYHIEFLRISEYVFAITPRYLASLG